MWTTAGAGNPSAMATTLNESTVEFSVNMTCQNCVNKVKKALIAEKDVSDFTVSLDKQSVVVTSSLPGKYSRDDAIVTFALPPFPILIVV